MGIMPGCKKCGGYTKYNNGLCYSCYPGKKSKAGKVYFGELTSKDGKKRIYTGQTKRAVYKRVGEHIDGQKSSSDKTYTSRFKNFKLLGSIFSKNRFKAEKSCKKLSSEKKRKLAGFGARKFKKFWS